MGGERGARYHLQPCVPSQRVSEADSRLRLYYGYGWKSRDEVWQVKVRAQDKQMYGGQHKSEEEARAAAIALHNQHHPSGPQAAVHTDRQGASMPHLLPDNDCSALTAAAGQAEQLPAGSNQPRPQTTTVPRDTPAKRPRKHRRAETERPTVSKRMRGALSSREAAADMKKRPVVFDPLQRYQNPGSLTAKQKQQQPQQQQTGQHAPPRQHSMPQSLPDQDTGVCNQASESAHITALQAEELRQHRHAGTLSDAQEWPQPARRCMDCCTAGADQEDSRSIRCLQSALSRRGYSTNSGGAYGSAAARGVCVAISNP